MDNRMLSIIARKSDITRLEKQRDGVLKTLKRKEMILADLNRAVLDLQRALSEYDSKINYLQGIVDVMEEEGY